MTPPAHVHLNDHHRRTAEAIFAHPVSHNIEWRDVLSLLEHAGTVTEEHDGKVNVTLGGETEWLHRPHGKDIGEQMVVDLRRMLTEAGITPETIKHREGETIEAASAPPRHAILVISDEGADVFPTDAEGGAPTRIVPHDPRGPLQHMRHDASGQTGWYGRVEDEWYEPIAEALRPADEILILGNGRGHSNAMLQFTQYLARNDTELLKRVAGAVETDAEELTDAEVLARAGEFYGEPTRAID